MRQGSVDRTTRETSIQASINLDGTGQADVNTGVGFFDHMLTHLAKHGGFDVSVQAKGDLEIDPHHTVEDVGICLGQAFLQAAGTGEGIHRFGHVAGAPQGVPQPMGRRGLGGSHRRVVDLRE